MSVTEWKREKRAGIRNRETRQCDKAKITINSNKQ